MNGNDPQKSFHKKYANILNEIIELSKKKYNEKQFLQCNNDPRETWQVINSALTTKNLKNSTNHKIDKLKIDSQELFDGNEIVQSSIHILQPQEKN